MILVVLILIVIITFYLIYKMYYQQIGSTCGFFALVYGISRVRCINKRKIVRCLVMDSINCGDSYVGEIFDVDKMYQISKKYFPSVNIQIVKINGIDDLDEQLENNFVIYPYNSNGTPHYCFLENKTKSNYIYRHFCFCRKRKIDKKDLYQKNKELEDVPVFIWKTYYDQKKCFLTWFGFCSIKKIISDFKLYRFLVENERQKKEKLYFKKTDVNMKGKIIIISRK